MENKSFLVGIIAIIIGASGLGLGAFSIVNFQTVEGPQGLPGNDGTDGQDGQDIVGLQVGILDPDQYEIVSGLVEVRILLWNSSECSINVYINGSLNATSVPWIWNTTTVSDGWWNVSVRAIDTESNSAQDEVIAYVLNNPIPIPRARVYQNLSYTIGAQAWINYEVKNYDNTDSFNLASERYTIPENGYYLLIASAWLSMDALSLGELVIFLGGGILSEAPFLIGSIGEEITISITDIIYFSVGSWITVDVVLFLGGGTIIGGSSRTFFSITKLSD